MPAKREVWVVENRQDIREPWSVSIARVKEDDARFALEDLNTRYPDRTRQVTRYVPAPAPKKAKVKNAR